MKTKEQKTQIKAKSMHRVSDKVKNVTRDESLDQYTNKDFTSSKDTLAEKHKVLAQVAVEQYRNKTSSGQL